MDDDTRIGLAVILATAAAIITFFVVAEYVGLYGFFAGIYAGMAAALVTYILVAYWPRKKRRRPADDSPPGSDQDEP